MCHGNVYKSVTGCGSAWLERLVWDQEVAGSNPVTPIPAGVVQWSNTSLPSWIRGFDSHHPLKDEFPYESVAQLDRATAF